jgi:hypothetical protein
MSFLRRCRVELSVDALDGVTREFLRAARRRLLYFPGSRAANKLGIAAPRWTSRPIGIGFLLHELLERFKEPGHARRFTLPAGGLPWLPRRAGSDYDPVQAGAGSVREGR